MPETGQGAPLFKNTSKALLLPLLLLILCHCGKGPQGPFFDPHAVMPSSALPALRGYAVRRGIIHCHSPYSHDACDGEPFPNGSRDEVCFQDLRDGICRTRQDFVFLTDHDNHFAEHPYPDVLLHAAGDRLIERGGLPVANRLKCSDGHESIISAGTESEMMPIGLERHVGDTLQERKAAYGEASPQAIAALQEAGALVFLQHTEGWDMATILDLPIDGIEVYNLHQNLMDNMIGAIEILVRMLDAPESLPIPDLLIMPIFQENLADLERWAIASLKRRTPAILATDAHRNTFKGTLDDGERLDSFRRMMRWFSNYLLVPEGTVDDGVLKEAIGHGRLYGAFDFLGYPVGFDFHAQVGARIYEMGDEVPASSAVTLRLTLPTVFGLKPGGANPVLKGRILRALASGEWEEVKAGTGTLSFAATTGVYRAEVRMVPHHLRDWLGTRPADFLKEYVWIYGNPIYVK